MIYFIEGEILEHFSDYPAPGINTIIMSNAGVGYEIMVSINTFASLVNKRDLQRIYTYYHHKEDIVELYGFLTAQERKIFIDLLGVSGVGCKLGIKIFSTLSLSLLVSSIINQDHNMLSTVSGLGKKTASKIVLELKDKFAKKYSALSFEQEDKTSVKGETLSISVSALVSLDYSEAEARRTVFHILQSNPELEVEETIKLALKELASKV